MSSTPPPAPRWSDWQSADRWLQAWMAWEVRQARRRAGARAWRPGQPLRLLFAGYNGSRNTGADVRVEEMLRQVRHLVGDAQLRPSVLTIDPAASASYFLTAAQHTLPKIFPRFLARTVAGHDGVIACEGSMFKSKFASALSTMMVGSLGLALAENKPAVAYGGEAGAMEPGLAQLVAKVCPGALLMTRNQASSHILTGLGLPSEAGTDTAWTFTPRRPERANEVLTHAGWDGKQPIVTLCPINAFWWPVQPSLRKSAIQSLTGAYGPLHYGSIYFHSWDVQRRQKQRAYLRALARVAEVLQARHGAFINLVAMEALDGQACRTLQAMLPQPAPILSAATLDCDTLVAALRLSRLVISSRYHAIVTSMPGQVPSIGVTMDERITNLMTDRGQPELALGVDDRNLEDKLRTHAERLLHDPDPTRTAITQAVRHHLQRMGEMGRHFIDHLCTRLPGFEPAVGPDDSRDMLAYLPPMAPALQQLLC
ncbi:MAG: polysaccharide pyruvyl transferase family protein [Polyangiales bacterium]